MHLHRLATILTVSLAVSFSAYAQGANMNNEAAMRAALTVMTFDQFSTRCTQGRGFAAADAAKVQAWQTENSVDRFRARLRELTPMQKQQLDKAVATLAEQVERRGATPCQAAVAIIKTPEAQLARTSPQMLAQTPAAATSSQAAPPETPVASAPAATAPAASNRQQAEVVKQIEGFGFDTGMTMGVGGFLALNTTPVVLFRNGDVLKDVEGLAFDGGVEAHRRAKPGAWTRWRREGGELQLQRKEGWKAMHYQTVYSKLPDDLKLNGLFRSLRGSGTLAVGGTQSAAGWTDYRFSSDGTVVRGGGGGSSGETGDVSVVAKSVATNRRGRYRIEDGLLLHISYEDGSSERRILVADPKNPNGAIWLDGMGYVQRKK
jgi:hypothetical protein